MVGKKRSLGPSFPDELAKVTNKMSNFKKGQFAQWADFLLPNFAGDSPKKQLSIWTVTFFGVVCLILFFALFLRLFHLQIKEGRINRELADGNRIKIKVMHAPRGAIYDRAGKILAANSPAFRLKDSLITREEALELEVKNDPTISELEIDNVRNYPMGEKLAHVVGYVGQISQDQLKSDKYKNYSAGDRIGQAGIEAQYESLLRGVDGGEINEVDSQGRKLRTLRRVLPTPGQNIYLAIDADFQEKIYSLMKDGLAKANSCCGAAIAVNPKNGQILSLLSFPSFDPNIFTKNPDEAKVTEVFSHPNSPILNRTIGGTYPPGSTFKIVSSLAALESGKITPETIIYDNGVMYLGSFKFTNWYFNQYGRVEGPVHLVKALKRSNDSYFYQVGQTVGEKYLGEWAKKLLLGSKLGIDLPGEVAGLVPDDAWKQKTFGEVWYPGDTLHLAIGQGFLLNTPLQILGITSYIAADGKLYKPSILLSSKPKVLLSNLANLKWIKLIKQGLGQVAKDGGTAWPFFTFPIPTAGKTGTAEYGDPYKRTHAWYTAYAPVDDSEIAMTVLIEGGGEGSSVAAPIVKEAFRWYLSEDKNKLIQDVYVSATESARTLGE